MKCNVGGYDMAARLILGVVLVVVGLTVPMAMAWQVAVYVVAAIALVTGLVRYCPINALFGLNTCSKSKKHHEAKAA